MNNLLIITYYWPPSGGAGVQRWVKFTKYLVRLGITPHVLTVDPEYATYPQRDESIVKEVADGVHVYRTKSVEVYSLYKKIKGGGTVPYGGFANDEEKSLSIFEKLSRFIRGNFFIPDPRVGWNRFAYSKAKELIREHNISSVITTSPPHSTHLIGLKLKRRLGVEWCVDLNDPWTDIYYFKKLYPTALTYMLNRRLERKVVEQSDHIFVNCNSNLELYNSKSDLITEEKFSIVPNGYDPEDIERAESELIAEGKIIRSYLSHSLDNSCGLDKSSAEDLSCSEDIDSEQASFIIGYMGTISDVYNPEVLFSAIERAIEIGGRPIVFKLIGVASGGVWDQIRAHGLEETVIDCGYLPHLEALKEMMECNLVLNIFPETDFDGGVPGKLCEYIGAKKRIISISALDGDSAGIIDALGAGGVFERTMESELVEFILDEIKLVLDGSISTECSPRDAYSREYGANVIANIIKKE